MAKKNSLILLIIVLTCISQISIAQTHRDSIYLPVFKPNDKSISMLDDVLNTRHRFIEDDKGTFLVSGRFTADSLVIVNVRYDSTWRGYVLDDFESQRYYGCVIYKDRLFMLDNSFQQIDSFVFDSTRYKKGFVDYGSTKLIINDRAVIWSFILIDGKFERTMILPLGEIFDFDLEGVTS